MISSCMCAVWNMYYRNTKPKLTYLLFFTRFQCTATALMTARAATREDRTARVASRTTVRASASGELYLSCVPTYFSNFMLLFETYAMAHHKFAAFHFILFSTAIFSKLLQCHGQVQRTEQLEEVLPQEVLSMPLCTSAATPFVQHAEYTVQCSGGLARPIICSTAPSDLS